VGPAQVAARLLEAGFLKRFHPLVSARLSTMMHPFGAVILLAGGGLFAIPFTLLHGAGNGILTIARGTVPLAVFGPENYGYRLGILGAPSRIMQAHLWPLVPPSRPVWGAPIVSNRLCLSALVVLLLVGRGLVQSLSVCAALKSLSAMSLDAWWHWMTGRNQRSLKLMVAAN
jgi:hypothetical protein